MHAQTNETVAVAFDGATSPLFQLVNKSIGERRNRLRSASKLLNERELSWIRESVDLKNAIVSRS